MMKKIDTIIDKSYRKDCLENKDLKVFADYVDNKDEEDMKQIENFLHEIISSNRYSFKKHEMGIISSPIQCPYVSNLIQSSDCEFILIQSSQDCVFWTFISS